MRKERALDGETAEAPGTPTVPKLRYRFAASAIVFLAAALVLRVWFAWKYLNTYHPDELFQSLEPAHRLALGYGVVTWEWRYGVRSWLLPLLLSPAMRLAPSSPAVYLRLNALLLSLLSLSLVVLAYRWTARRAGSRFALAAAFLVATWYPLVYFAAKPLSEVVATDVFCAALLFADMWSIQRKPADDLVGGALFGLTAALRVQLVPAVLCALFLLSRSISAGQKRRILISFCVAIALFGCFDWITLGHPFQSAYLYIWMNLVQGKSAQYGVSPWNWYFKQLRPWLGLLAPFSAIGAFRYRELGWIILAILVPHMLVAHKELRFLYPAFPLFLILAVLGMAVLAQELKSALPAIPRQDFFAATTALVLLFSFRSVLTAREQGLWRRRDAPLYAYLHVNRDPAACGLILYGVPWHLSGGYTYLDRPIPIYLSKSPGELRRMSPGANRLLSTRQVADSLANWTSESCWGEVCLYRRENQCDRNIGPAINQQLQSAGE